MCELEIEETEQEETKRKLASIQMISEINSIPEADFIEEAVVGGWHCVVKKGEFLKGDLGIFFEIDSLLPPAPWSEFMEKYKRRVKTIKLKGIVCQGLVLPFSIFSPEEIERIGEIEDCKDVTDALGVKKYEAPIHSGGMGGKGMGKTKGNFPCHLVPKTDEIRVQSAFGYIRNENGEKVKGCVIDELTALPYSITLKCDGTSFTGLYVNGEYEACSRNQIKKDEDYNFYWDMSKKYNLAEKLSTCKNYAIQGEIIGPGVPNSGKSGNNIMGLDEIELAVFNVYDMEKREYLSFIDFIEFCNKFELKTVPMFETGMSFHYTMDELIDYASHAKYSNGNIAEGIVIRPQNETYSYILQGRLSFKVLSNEYLLKCER
jgi:RNA ligase (TIGR02306 family)